MRHKYKTVVIEVSLDPKTIDQILTLKRSPILENAYSIHFVHIYNSELKPRYLELSEGKTDFEAIEKCVLDKLEEIKNEIIAGLDVIGYSKTHCIFDRNVKLKAIQYIKEINADLVVAATRGMHGIEGMFTNSFSNFLVDHAPCDVHIIRPIRKENRSEL